MTTIGDIEATGELAFTVRPPGFEQIPGRTVLTRLNYYDGKFLRADALRAEQDYLRRLAQLGASAGGAGLVYGFDVALAGGEELTLAPGLAFDGAGRVLYLPGAVSVGLQAVIDATRRAFLTAARGTVGAGGFAVCAPDSATEAGGPASTGPEYLLISIAHAEAACGEEEVFGALCDDGCATATDRAYLVEGIVLRAAPWTPRTPFATAKAVALGTRHARSLFASAAFADETTNVASQISRAGLLTGSWCTGAPGPVGWEVPIAIVGRLGSITFVDEWIVRRERMSTPPQRFWSWTMAMRPWEAFLAQVLQFQCQLPSALAAGVTNGESDDNPCAPQVEVLAETMRYVRQLEATLARPGAEGKVLASLGGAVRLGDLHRKIAAALTRRTTPSQRVLIDGGIVELPPAGYLPVAPGTTPPVTAQVRRLLGPGVDLRFCVVRSDYVAHALEEAQHMERISLLQGLDDPAGKPQVDIYVPDGQTTPAQPEPLRMYDTRLTVVSQATSGPSRPTDLVLHGAGRADPNDDGGFELWFAGAWAPPPQVDPDERAGDLLRTAGRRLVRGPAVQAGLASWCALEIGRNPFAMSVGETARVFLNFELVRYGQAGTTSTVQVDGMLTLDAVTAASRKCTLSLASGLIDRAKGATERDTHALTGPYGVLFERDGTSTGAIVISVSLAKKTLLTFGADLRALGADGDAAVVWTGSRTDTKKPLMFAQLDPARDLIDPENATHQLADSAIALVADVLDDASFVKRATDQLFPPPAATPAPTVIATRDWVLFQRRRAIDCGGPVSLPVPMPVASKPIEGVGTSVAAFVGFAPGGPIDHPMRISNWTQFSRIFADPNEPANGPFMEGAFLAHAVSGFFLNGGGRCWVVRVADDDGSDDPGATLRAALPAATDASIVTYSAVALSAGSSDMTVEIAEEPSPGGTYTVKVAVDGTVHEEFTGLTTKKGRTNLATKINAASKLIKIEDAGASLPQAQRNPATGVFTLSIDPLEIMASRLEGDVDERTGMGGLAALDEITMVAMPDMVSRTRDDGDEVLVRDLQAKLIAHCENAGDRMAILDCPNNLLPQEVLEWRMNTAGYDSKFAVLYYPWIEVMDPVTEKPIMVPPSGHIAGLWCRTDAARGVHAAPDNEAVMSADALGFQLTQGDEASLHKVGINCLHSFADGDIRVSGARTLSTDPEWRYINVRRLVNYISESIMEGTQWIKFEPNDEQLWTQLRNAVSNFLTPLWNDGALFGSTLSQAFYVKCDSETNTPAVIAAGQVICEIAIAPLEPAEFVVFSVSLSSGGGGSTIT